MNWQSVWITFALLTGGFVLMVGLGRALYWLEERYGSARTSTILFLIVIGVGALIVGWATR